MILRISIVIAFAHLWLSQSIGQPLSREQVLEDLNELQTELEKFHAGYTRYTYKQQLDDLFEKLKSETAETSVLDFYKNVTLITSKIRCGHTRASLPNEATRELEISNTFLPFTVSILNGKLYVYRSLDPTLQPGNEIISINNLSIPDILDMIFEHHSSDGFIKSGKTRITEFYFHYYFHLYLANGASSFRIVLTNPHETTVTVSGKSWDEMEKIRHQFPSRATMELEHFEDYSYFKIGTFGASSLKRNGFNYKSFLADSFRQLKDQNVKNLILDLRGNGGGTDEFGALLVSYLLSESFGYFERIEVTDDYKSYGRIRKTEKFNLMTSHSGLSERYVQRNNFGGKLYLLVDGWTFSTAADVVSVIDNANRALIVGEETAGGRFGNTSGVSESLVLSNSKIRINLPMWKYTTALSEEVDDGRGVIPDVQIIPTIQQVLHGEDIALKYCLDTIRNLGR